MTTAPAVAPEDRVPIRTKIFYGAGTGAEQIALTSIGAYAVFFYNQVLGVPATMAALAVTFSLVFDAVSDPLVGSLSDRTRHRLGRRHPWMFIAPIPIAVSLYFIFAPPVGMLSPFWLFVWFATFVTLLRQFMTFFHVPHLALGGELSTNYTERSQVMAYNNFAGWMGGAGKTWVALTFFFYATPEYPRGLLNPEAYPKYALLASGMVLVVLFASAWFTRDVIPRLPKPPLNLPKYSISQFYGDMAKAMTNMNYLWLLIAFFFLSCMLGVRAGLNLYVNTFFWGLGSEQIRWFVFGSMAAYAFGFFASARLHRRFDKRHTIVVTAVLLSVTPAVPVTLAMFGLYFPNNSPLLLPSLICFAAITAVGASVLNISVNSALADIADENEAKHGLRQEGVLYSTRSFFGKVDGAIGTLLAGLALDFIAFPERATPGQVPQETLWNLALVDGLLAMIPGIICLYFYGKYKINKQSYEATRAEIERRRANARAAAAEAAINEENIGPSSETLQPKPGGAS